MNLRKYFVFVLALLTFTVWSEDYVPGVTIARFEPGVIILPKGKEEAPIDEVTVTDGAVRAVFNEYGVYKVKKLYPGSLPDDTLEIRPTGDIIIVSDYSLVYLLYFPEDKDVTAFVEDLSHCEKVVWATMDHIYECFKFPNDEYFGEPYWYQWGLYNWGQYNYEPDVDVNATEAWDLTTGHWYSMVGEATTVYL